MDISNNNLGYNKKTTDKVLLKKIEDLEKRVENVENLGDIDLGDIDLNLDNYITKDELERRNYLTQEDMPFVDEFVTDTELSSLITLNKNTSTTTSIGGIKEGENISGLTAIEILNKMLFPYSAPFVSVMITPSSGLYEKGDYKTITNVKVTIQKKSEKITKIEVLDGENVLVSKTDSDIALGGVFNLSTNLMIKDNKILTAKVTDNANKVTSVNFNTYTYVYPYYAGVCNEEEEINESLIKSLNKQVEEKSNKSISYTTNNQKMIFAYPKSYGLLNKIIDQNNFDITSSFSVSELNITCLDENTQTYYIYKNNSSTVNNFKINFNY